MLKLRSMFQKHKRVSSNDVVPDNIGSGWELQTTVGQFADDMQFVNSATLPRGIAKMTSRSAGSLKQLLPVSSNFRHLASVLFINAVATCLGTLATPYFEAILPRVACKNLPMMHYILYIFNNGSSYLIYRIKI